LKGTYELDYKSKSHTLAIELENGEIVIEERNNSALKDKTLADHFITRFSTIKIFCTPKCSTFTEKDGGDFIQIHFPDYIRKERLKIPKGNSNFEVKKTVKMIFEEIKANNIIKELNVTLDDFRLYKMDVARTLCEQDNILGMYQEPKKNVNKKMIYNFMFDM
jgi:hypothetical protein